jgi:hypothetical protein
MAADITRIIALGASNLTRGLQTVVSTARRTWGPDVEVVGALGHGRSYGVPSRVVIRTLPGILESGLWHTLSSLPAAKTRGLVTDVGNDILYGYPAPTVLAWVEEAVDRLERVTPDIVVTDLPLDSIRRLSTPAFLVFRSLLAPQCRLSLAEIVDTAERVNHGLASLVAARGLHFVRMRREWYGVDPIHIRPRLWRPAWQQILGCGTGHESGDGSTSGAWPEGLSLYFMPPERQWLFGVERTSQQTGTALARGGRVWLF